MIDLLVMERLARKRTQRAYYECEDCGRRFEGWGDPEGIGCLDCGVRGAPIRRAGGGAGPGANADAEVEADTDAVADD